MRRFIFVFMLLLLSAAAFAVDDARFQARYNDLGVRVQCACGCGQALIQCNHVGCTYSDNMIRQLRSTVTNFSNDEDVLNWFRRQYGSTVVTEPSTHGFELTIWVVPPVLGAAAILLLSFLVRRWRLRAALAAPMAGDARLTEFRSRARMETEL